ncbi:MAG: four helix bundle protein [Deltaproteobacteria bacterium]|nr:four helix bundle protein [Deltaproteobacteria bacterium]
MSGRGKGKRTRTSHEPARFVKRERGKDRERQGREPGIESGAEGHRTGPGLRPSLREPGETERDRPGKAWRSGSGKRASRREDRKPEQRRSGGTWGSGARTRSERREHGKPDRAQTHERREPAPAPRDEDGLWAAARSGTGLAGYLRFGDIPAHKLGRVLRNHLYKLAGDPELEDEKANLAGRIKQAATTVTASLATGFGEGTFRSGVSRALESRGALYAIQDHLEQLVDMERIDAARLEDCKREVDEVIAAVNAFLGVLVRERDRATRG